MGAGRYWIGFGDIHEDVRNVARIPGLEEAAGIIVSGDLTNRGGIQAARRVLDVIRERNPVVYAQIGNMDYAEVDRYLDEQGWNIHGRSLELAPGLALVGVGASTPTPFGTPSEFPDEVLGEILERAFEPVRDYPHILLVAHNPPFGTATDRVGAGVSVGSRAVRAFIEAHQPEVCLTGHIHEARAVDTVGRTLVINPGALAAGGYAVLAFDGSLSAELKTV